MGTELAARRKIVVRHGEFRQDVAISPDLPIGVSLQGVGADPLDPAVIAVDAMGQKIDLSTHPEQALPDGSVITFVDLGLKLPRSPETSISIQPEQRLLSLSRIAWWIAAVAVALLGITATIFLIEDAVQLRSPAISDPIGWAPSSWLRLGISLSLLGIAVWAALSGRASPLDPARSRSGIWTALGSDGRAIGSMIVAPLAGGAAAVVAVPVVALGQGQLVVFFALVGAALISAVGFAVRRGAVFGPAFGFLTAMLAIAAAICGGTLLLGWPGEVAAAVFVGMVPPALRALPSWCLDVPESQLIDMADQSTMRWTVRGVQPSEPELISTQGVSQMVLGSTLQRDVGTIVLCVIPVLLLPVVFLRISSGTVQWWGAIGLAVTVVIALVYQPRVARDIISRWAPRMAAGLVLVELALGAVLFANDQATMFATIALLCALVSGVAIFPLVRGYRSLGMSRTADIIERISVVLALPAGLVAAGLIELLRVVTSG